MVPNGTSVRHSLLDRIILVVFPKLPFQNKLRKIRKFTSRKPPILPILPTVNLICKQVTPFEVNFAAQNQLGRRSAENATRSNSDQEHSAITTICISYVVPTKRFRRRYFSGHRENSHQRQPTMWHFLLPSWTEERQTNGRLGNRQKFDSVLWLIR